MFLPNWLRPRRPVTIRRHATGMSRFIRPQLERLEDRITPTGPITLTAANAAQLQAAVTTADSNPTQQYIIQLTGPSPYNLTAELDLDNSAGVTITGSSTVLNAYTGSRVFQVAAGANLTLQNLTVQNGFSATQGGGILDLGGNLALTNVVVQSNSVAAGTQAGNGLDAQGGGIYASGGALTIKSSTFQGNLAIGGDAANGRTGTVNNPNGGNAGFGGSGQGGGLFSVDSTLTIIDSSFTSNSALGGFGGSGGHAYSGHKGANGGSGGFGGTGLGGGLYVSGSNLQLIENTTLSNNLAQGGDGGSGQSGMPRGTNKAAGYSYGNGGNGGNGGDGGNAAGGGIFQDSGSLSLTNNSLLGNHAYGGGAGGAGGAGPGGYNSGTGGAGGNGGNGGSGRGGGLFVNAAVLINNTVAKNSVSAAGGVGGAGGGGGASAGGNGGIGGSGGLAGGGGVYDNYAGQSSYINNTIAYNTATGGNGTPGGSGGLQNGKPGTAGTSAIASGGGYYNGSDLGRTPNFTNNLLQGNTAATSGPDFFGLVDSAATNNFVSNSTGATTFNPTNNKLNDSTNQLGSLTTASNGTSYYPLLPFTASINGGTNSVLPAIAEAEGVPQDQATDQIGNPRIVGSTDIIDIGATEFQGLPTTTTVTPTTTMCAATQRLVTLTASVTDDIGAAVTEGEATFTVVDANNNPVGTPVTVAVNNTGQASAQYTIPAGTPVGSYTIQAAYTDDQPPSDTGNFAPSNGKSTLTINQCAITISPPSLPLPPVFACNHPVIVSVTIASPDEPIVNEGAVVFTLIGPNGSPSISSNPVPVENGIASTANVPNNANLIVPFAVPSGSYSLQVSYTDTNPPYPGNFQSQTATFANAVTVQTPSTDVAVSDVTLDYSPSPQTVTLTAGVTSKDCPPVTEGAVTFTVTTPSGTIVVPTTGPINVSNNQASTSVTIPGALPPGDYIIQASYTDSFKGYSPSTGMGTLTVKPPSGSVANVSVPYRGIDPDTNLNNQITLTAAVTDRLSIPIDDGQVAFKVFDSSGNQVGNTTLSTSVQNGQAQALFTLPQGTLLGNYTITAAYNGPNNTFSIPIGTGTLTIATAPTTVYITNVSFSFGFFEQDTFTAYVVSNPQYSFTNPQLQGGFMVNEGSMTFTDMGQTMTVPVVNSVATATFDIPVFAENPLTQSFTAAYNPSTNDYIASSSTPPLTMAQEMQVLMNYLIQIMVLQFIMNHMPSHS